MLAVYCMRRGQCLAGRLLAQNHAVAAERHEVGRVRLPARDAFDQKSAVRIPDFASRETLERQMIEIADCHRGDSA